jgi:WD40 repeat protein
MSIFKVNKLVTLTGHNDCIYALTEGANPRYFYTGSADGMVVEWDLDAPKNGKLIARLPHSVYALHVDHARNLLFIGHNFEGIHVIDLKESKEIWSIKLTDQAIFDIAIYGDEGYIGCGDGVMIVVDIPSKSVKKHIKLGEKSIRVFALAYDKKHLAVGMSDHSITILDLNQDLKPIQSLLGHTNSVFALAYSLDESVLVSGSRDARLKIWGTADYTLSETIVAHMYAINYISFRGHGDYLVSCSMDKSIKIWDISARKLLKVIDKARNAGHSTSINKVIWSKYNDTIVSVSDDRTISIWQIEKI